MLSPVQAYEKAEKEGPSEHTRGVVLSSPMHSYYYAFYIDEDPRDDTRKAVLSSAGYSYLYALYVDENIFRGNNNYHYFVDIHNIGMRYIREYKLNIGFMSVGYFYLDVL